MANNFQITEGSGVTIRAQEKDTDKKHQVVILDLGGSGAENLLDVGQENEANSLPVALATEQEALIGATNETAPAGDTDPSGLNGRLQRIAQRLSTLAGYLDGVETALAGLAVESGGNLAALAASASVLDDWDEADRAKVNVIAGQAGITGGAGAVAVNTPRVTHASDDPVTVAAQIMDDWDESDRAKVNAQEVSGVMIENAVPVTVKSAVIDAATSGDNTLVAAVSTKKIRVLSLFLVAAGTVIARFESGAGGTALTGQMNLVANTGFVLPHNPHGWFQTGESALLNLELSAAISVDGSLTYIEVE